MYHLHSRIKISTCLACYLSYSVQMADISCIMNNSRLICR